MTTPLGLPLHVQTVTVGERQLQVLLPDEAATKAAYQRGAIPFPYWSRVWPSAIALAAFIAQQPHLVQNKIVLELGAGLGLPSLVAANYAKRVVCTDASADAVAVVKQTAGLNRIANLEALVMNWTSITPTTTADVLLLSDVNYEPKTFENLHAVIKQFLSGNATVLLATPQRLMAKAFIEPLLQYSIQQQTARVNDADILLMVLQALPNKKPLQTKGPDFV